MAVSGEKVSTLLAQVDVWECKGLTLRGVIFVERGAWAGGGVVNVVNVVIHE